jgi:DNA replication and repair protein RecF
VRLLELRARGWRNLEPLDFVPGPRVNVLHGENGQGKTNLIEAIYYLATLRSFRTSHADELVAGGPGQVDAGRAELRARIEHRGLDRKVEIKLGPDGRTVTLDGKQVRGAAAIFGAVSVVLFVPEDLLLPRAAPSARRRFLDLAVFNVERGYYREAAAFQKVVKSRNHLLKRGAIERRVDPVLLDAYDEELARTGARVVSRRRALVGELAPRARDFFRELHGDLLVELRYRSAPAVDAAGDEAAIQAALLAELRAQRALDERRRFTGTGPHTDDLEIVLAGRLAREHASQGQLRSLVLALKLAELTNVEARRDDVPVLLLDDVPSELDRTRRKFLFDMVGGLSCQTLISVTEREVVSPLTDRVDFQVTRGQVLP